jgi:CRP-like cAMP-binding protein
MAAARSMRRLRSAESANSRSTALREVPRRVASASTSLRRSSGIETMTFAISLVYQGIRPERGGTDQAMPTTGATNDTRFARRKFRPLNCAASVRVVVSHMA